jgi:hypothetical protein
VPPGPGVVSRAARARLDEAQRQALIEATRRACATALANPDEPRAQSKAAALARELLASGDQSVAVASVLDWAQPALTRLDSACATRAEAAAVYAQARDHARAADFFSRAALECQAADSAIAAAEALRQTGRCDQALSLLATSWSWSRPDQHIPLLDQVAWCSDELSLRGNLAFAPPDVVEDYLALLNRRADEAKARERSANCRSQCATARSSCWSGCPPGAHGCDANCSSLESFCLAGCP